jgi:hypothetical protein
MTTEESVLNGRNGQAAPPLGPFANGEAPRLDGRTADGRFAAGNKGGPGNPHARATAARRKALTEAVTAR